MTFPLPSTSAPRAFPRALVATALVLALAGCADMRGLKPDLAQASPDRLSARHSLAGIPLTPAAWPRSDWWTAFGDPQLDALVSEALAGSPSLEAADARVRLALSQANLQDAARKPQVEAKAQYSGIRIPATVAPEPFGGHYLGVIIASAGLSYAPDLWGGKRAAWEAAVDQAHASQVDAQAARLALSSNVVQAYLQLARASDIADIAERERGRTTGLQKLTAQRVKAGLDSGFQQRQADANVATAQRGVEAAQEAQALARSALAALVGQGPDRAASIAPPRALEAAALSLPSDLPSDLLARRPDIVAARWRIEAANRSIGVAKAQFYPSINLTASVGSAGSNLSSLFSLPGRYLQLGPSLSLPIFDGGRLRANLAGRDADYDAAVAQYDQTLVGAVHEVDEQVVTIRALDTQIATQQQAIASARGAYDLGQLRYRGGLATQLDVLSVQQPLLLAEQQLADLRAQRLAASARLAQALGGGFTPEAPVASAPPAAATTNRPTSVR